MDGNNKINNENSKENGTPDYEKLTPWNFHEYPVRVNSIRYNQDFSLLTLGTSKGYKIFLASNLLPAHEDTLAIKNLDDISIAMVYFKSSLVFLLPSRYNENFTNSELIIFDDFHQKKIASFKDKTEELLNFSLSTNIILLVTISRITVIELNTFKIIDIIDNVNTMNKLFSFNFHDYVAYLKLDDKKNIFVKYYQNENHKIKSLVKKKFSSNFEFLQIISLSPCGNYLCIVSIFGNKIHIFDIKNDKLKYCMYLGGSILVIEKIFFSEKNSNYLFVLKKENKFNVYKLPLKTKTENECVCKKYDDNKISTENKKEGGFFGYFRRFSKNKDLWESHANGELDGQILFLDFDRNKNKDIIYINEGGEFIKYHFNKTHTGNILPYVKVQWM